MRARHCAILAAALATAAVVAVPVPAAAGTGRGAGGQTLTVTPSTGLSRSGATVSISGRGYDVTKGIYVAYCVDNGAGAVPTPCGGGADTSGSLGASHWISSNPPSYGEGLAEPYGAGGSFSVTLKVTTTIGDVDCTVRRCAVVTRADHTRTSDRTQDVRVPITFATAGTPTKAKPAPATTTTTPKTTTRSTPPPSTSAAAPPAAGEPPATDAGAAPTIAAASELHVTRVSDASGAGRGWTLGLAALGLAMVALIGLGRWRRRRGATR
ncbi:hypothetical protein [Rhizomonospora bruguierae]|uniref:hypothetical protein n=1 Tax=Rhizomonospora bruguierae TaxID=1581705 RepID=UPI001BD01DED|nr:hypothetical protein [Micromonospora sp. NBRC 107566]